MRSIVFEEVGKRPCDTTVVAFKHMVSFDLEDVSSSLVPILL
tara:strand:- start:4213 stop:4338 length:126 start_codon:yes stop_codon:yes gene_type:complete